MAAARAEVLSLALEQANEERLQLHAASKIQAVYRGKSARKEMEQKLLEAGTPEATTKLLHLRDAQGAAKAAQAGPAEVHFKAGCVAVGGGQLAEAAVNCQVAELMRKLRLVDAAVEFQAALDAGHPRRGRCHNGLGLVATQQGEWAEAVSQFTAAIGHDPLDYRALHNRAEARKRKGDYKGAMADAQQASEINTTGCAFGLGGGVSLYQSHPTNPRGGVSLFQSHPTIQRGAGMRVSTGIHGW